MAAIRILFLSILTVAAVCSSNPLKSVSLADCAIGNFTVGDSAEVVLQALGEPKRNLLLKLPTNDFTHREIQYDGITITLSQHGRTAMSYAVQSPDYRLPSGVGVGSTRAEVLEALGPARSQFDDRSEAWTYNLVDRDGQAIPAVLRFSFDGNVVAHFAVSTM